MSQETQKQLRIITREELEKHNEENDNQWICIEGYVCDVTEYKILHPGGDDILLEHAGSDATEAFDNAGHSDEAREKVRSLAIGKLEGYSEKKSSSKPQDEEKEESTSIFSYLKYIIVPAAIFGIAYYIQKFNMK